MQDVLVYNIVENSEETKPFYMNPSTGQIMLINVLNGKNKDKYQVTSFY